MQMPCSPEASGACDIQKLCQEIELEVGTGSSFPLECQQTVRSSSSTRGIPVLCTGSENIDELMQLDANSQKDGASTPTGARTKVTD